jgi:hypothetical protein
MQGCHEFLVWRELLSCVAPTPEDTVAGTEGYTAFIEAERRAISVGETILQTGLWRDSFVRWKETIHLSGGA